MKGLLVAMSILAQMPPMQPPSGAPEYRTGWCDGFNTAYEMLMQKRDHYRALLKQPKMSPDEVIDWIYSRPWIDGPSSHTAPRRLGQPPGVPQIGPPPIESVDLYLMLPTKCAMPSS